MQDPSVVEGDEFPGSQGDFDCVIVAVEEIHERPLGGVEASYVG